MIITSWERVENNQFLHLLTTKLTVMTKKVFRAIPNGPKTDPIIPIEGNWWDVE